MAGLLDKIKEIQAAQLAKSQAAKLAQVGPTGTEQKMQAMMQGSMGQNPATGEYDVPLAPQQQTMNGAPIANMGGDSQLQEYLKKQALLKAGQK